MFTPSWNMSVVLEHRCQCKGLRASLFWPIPFLSFLRQHCLYLVGRSINSLKQLVLCSQLGTKGCDYTQTVTPVHSTRWEGWVVYGKDCDRETNFDSHSLTLEIVQTQCKGAQNERASDGRTEVEIFGQIQLFCHNSEQKDGHCMLGTQSTCSNLVLSANMPARTTGWIEPLLACRVIAS